MKIVLVTHLPLQHQRDVLRDVLGDRFEVSMCDTVPADPDVVGIVAEPDLSFTSKDLARATGLRAVVTPSVATDHIDVAGAAALGIHVLNSPGVNRRETADHTLALILALIRDLPGGVAAARRGQWDATRTHPQQIRGRRLGLLGFGAIAQLVAKDAVALGMSVLVHNRRGITDEAAGAGVRVASDLPEMLGWADVVSVHVPLTPATRGLIGAQQLRMMKPGASIVNTARGQIIDGAALLRALDEGHILSAALDVLDTEEPSPEHPLLRHERVIVTPHMGWYSPMSAVELYRVVGAKLRAALS